MIESFTEFLSEPVSLGRLVVFLIIWDWWRAILNGVGECVRNAR